MAIPLNYTGVAERLKMAAETWVSIDVDPPVMLTDTMGYVRACVTLKDGRHAHGTAHFRLGLTGPSAQAKFPVEDCETSAVGRALGFFGFGTLEHFPSREEMARVETFNQPEPPAQLRAQPPVNRVATKPAGLDRQAAIKKIKLMWLSEEAKGYDLTQQHEEKYMPLENIGDVSDDELVALGHKVKARLQAAAVAAEIVEAGSSIASSGRASREIVEPEPAAA